MPEEVVMQPCTQTDRIGRMEQNVQDIAKQTNEIANSVAILVVKLEPVITKVYENERALRGTNGDMGLVARVVGMTDVVNDLSVTIKGKGEDTGLVGEVSGIGKTIKEWADNQKWLFRMIVGWLVTTALGAAYYFITLPRP